MSCFKAAVLESALHLHERLISKDILPLHQHLVQRFSQMQKSIGTTSVPLNQIGAAMHRKNNNGTQNNPLPQGILNSAYFVTKVYISKLSFNNFLVQSTISDSKMSLETHSIPSDSRKSSSSSSLSLSLYGHMVSGFKLSFFYFVI
jgi:hypothetical protein